MAANSPFMNMDNVNHSSTVTAATWPELQVPNFKSFAPSLPISQALVVPSSSPFSPTGTKPKAFDFSFQVLEQPPPPPALPTNMVSIEQPAWDFSDSVKQQPEFNNSGAQYHQTSQYVNNRKVEDGYNWRKYGQKQVKGSENPRSYYKCTYPNCPTKKKVERSLDGQITEIVYKGSHNHPKPQSTRGSIEEDEFDQASPISNTNGDDINEMNLIPKDGENENEGIIGSGSKAVKSRELSCKQIVISTFSMMVIDGGNMGRKSYYKCTMIGCPVRKHVERASHDLQAVITTYEGKHNHDVPAARGSGYTMNRPTSTATANNVNAPMAMPTRPSAVQSKPFNIIYTNSGSTWEMPQHNNGGFGLSRLSKPIGSYMSQTQFSDTVFAKDEPRDDSFLDGFLS
ncbi:putative WRKY transcription factor 26 [Hibiscus syriacus]|uniref:WRKY transcription factor 26 n=1 Tax=Hibiscus syriacus TaxID=106335 RepID=A0A6A2ZNU2_HIBSY|nr:putative WRKY transcription factor 26 [Hibiscus syriacus]